MRSLRRLGLEADRAGLRALGVDVLGATLLSCVISHLLYLRGARTA